MRLSALLIAAVFAVGCGDEPEGEPVATAPPGAQGAPAAPAAPPTETAPPEEAQPQQEIPEIPAHDDAAEPPEPELFFLFPEEEDARVAASELEHHGYRVRTTPPADDIPEWSVIAEGAPEGGGLAAAEERFRAWARARNGRYDGNEIPVGP